MSKVTSKGSVSVPSRWRIEDEPEKLVKNFTVRTTHQLYTGDGKGDGYFTFAQTYYQIPTKYMSKAVVAFLENRKGRIVK